MAIFSGLTESRIWKKARKSCAFGLAMSVVSSVVSACAPAGDPLTIKTGPPSTVVYSSNPARYPYGVTITPNELQAQGSPISTVTIDTALPEGLEFDPLTGTISGTPESITAPQEYRITARNSHGSNFVRLVLEITDLPPEMTYAGVTTLNLNVGVAVPPITPTLAGGATLSCEAVPALPAGMALSDQCEISGTPLVGQAATTHLISAINSGGASTLEFTITVNDLAPNIAYAGSPYVWTRGASVANLVPSNAGGGVVTLCSSSPDLPTGLSLAADCTLSGTPSALAPATDYTITGSNVNGVTDSAIVNITVVDILPAVSFSGTPFSYVRNTAIAAATPENAGGVVDSCASTSALPAGLSLHDTTCVITGTPTEAATTANYVIRATNTAGFADTTVSITVTDIPPKLVYFGTSFIFVAGQEITPIVPIPSTGGDVTSCVSVPALPAGLSVHNTTCVITGTPTSGATLKNYVITASNSGGSSQKTLSITVQEIPPAISYAGSPFAFEKNVAITPVSVANTGGAITGCSANPGLPSGLALSTGCAISGTPSAVLAAADYVITASNSAGTSQATVNIAVSEQAPSIAYPGSPYSFARNSAITTINVVNSGGPITSCSSAPALPAGLAIANTTCAISGTPSAVTAAADYTVTASNATGSSNAVINVTVNDVAPAISYPASPFSFTKDVAIAATAATNMGGAPVSCTPNPALPAGLSLAADCTITGTPTLLSAAAPYTITATNTGGSSNAILSIAVKDTPPTLSFSPTTLTFTKDVAIAAQTPTLTGGAVVSCSSNPALPAGLSIQATTCVISGTPTSVSAAANYLITATNSGGSSSVTLNIAVNDLLPVISYVGSPFTHTKGSAIAAMNPVNTGGAIVSCASLPALPAGLSLSNGCVISGTPGIVSAAIDYTITATNSAGSASTPVNIRVNDIPPVISYAGSPFTHVVGTPIASLSPANTGGAIISCGANPTLPAGFSLSAACTLSGTPSSPTAQNDYVITATNSGGTSDFTIRITVNDLAPNINFAGSPFSYPEDLPIAPLSPTNTGGVVVSCGSVPALPAGLSIAPNCTISGTPANITPAADYTITATNSGGSSIKVINLTISEAPPVLSYAGGPFTYTKDAAIAPLSPTNTGGGVTSCNSVPALPAGLALSSTCVISGTPSALSASAIYTITGTNAGGSANAPVTISVVDVAPAIDYLPTSYSFVYTVNVAIDPLTPNSTAGPIASCSVSPALPTGLVINPANCTISGTPTAARAATNYTVTATNTGGASAAVITITVLDEAPNISYAGSPYTLYRTIAIAPISPSNSGGAISSCASAPPLPPGLNISAGCVITGTPTALSAATNYTITATNAIGNSAVVISINVQDPAPAITFAGSPFSFAKSIAMTPLSPTNTGGAPSTCTSNPVLPAGLSISNSCVISGTPSNITAAADYTITATNPTGSSLQTINITITETPPAISYAGGPYSYTKNQLIAPLSASNTGGPITSCNSAPGLPAGLSISATCQITGTPSTPTAAANYTITASNAGGSNQATINITIQDVVPNISYTPASFVYTIQETIANVTPNSTGGTITGCGSVPALPAGLSISSTCVISGAPTVVVAAADYTITATNAAGSANTVVNIRVKNQPQILFYGFSALNGSDNGSAPLSQNIWKTTVDGLVRTALTANSNGNLSSVKPVFSPDGSLVLSTSRRALEGYNNGTPAGSYNVWKSSNTGTSPAPLTSNANAGLESTDAVFSPAGNKIAFASKTALNGSANGVGTESYNIWIMNAAGTGKTALTANTNAGLDSYSPAFSPDGQFLYFYSKTALSGAMNETAPGSFNIWKINVNGTGLTPLTNESGAGFDSYDPRISPDGTKLVYSSMAMIGGAPTSSMNVWTMNTDGTAKTFLTNNTAASYDSKQPQFSPDGTEIVFASKMNVNAATASSFNIWKMAVNGSSQVSLTTNNAANLDSESPVFSSDNLKIVFTSKMNIGVNQALSKNIWIMNSDGTSRSSITGNTNAGLDSFLAPGQIWFQD